MSTFAQRIKASNPWLGKIPPGAHGSGPIQKKYWKVTSDFVRIRDFYAFGGECISCPRRLDWIDLQAGHCKAWGACRGYSKWDLLNIFGQCPYCNKNGDALTGQTFIDKIKYRYGKSRLQYIEELAKYPTEKLEDFQIVEKMKALLREMGNLPTQPDYYEKIKQYI